MSDFDRFIIRPQEPIEPSAIVSQTPETDTDGREVAQTEIRTPDQFDPMPPKGAAEFENGRHALVEALHHEVATREETADARISSLIAEIKGLTLEPRPTDQPVHGHEGPLDGIRHYCQGVMGAIGGFFTAVFGHSEPKLDRPDAHTAEVAKKIGIDVEELK